MSSEVRAILFKITFNHQYMNYPWILYLNEAMEWNPAGP